MSKMIFVNLPVQDLATAARFYEAIGCRKNDQFSDENAASMVWSDEITFQLLTRDYFQTFISKSIPNAKESCQVLIALSCDTRDAVDRIVAAGDRAGGSSAVREVQDLGFMYNRAIEDPDGHVLEFAWMDMSAMSDVAADTQG
jgi:uncharacterized protein